MTEEEQKHYRDIIYPQIVKREREKKIYREYEKMEENKKFIVASTSGISSGKVVYHILDEYYKCLCGSTGYFFIVKDKMIAPTCKKCMTKAKKIKEKENVG